MSTGEIIKATRKAKGFSVKVISEQTGISSATLFRYENGEISKIPMNNIIAIAKVLQVPTAKLMGDNSPEVMGGDIAGTEPLPAFKMLPILGQIACGEPLFAEGNISGYQGVPSDIPADFILRCQGDSMINARIYHDDIVYVKSQNYGENGDIVVAMIDDCATLKRLYKYPGQVVLQPENPNYPPLIYTENDFENVFIIGKVVGFTSKCL